MSDTEPDEQAAWHPAPVGPDDDPFAPAPLGVPRTPTGNADVDAALERLADADHLTTDGHIEVYEDVHRGLRDALTALDARPGPPAPPSSYPTASPPAPSPQSPYQSRS
ncbi:hypothetical protein MTQ10_08020 [Streptomyces sp. XM83C]|jgi:hypothetical protein|uniref:Uncharacterized protein n=1 Tax=Streptomyces thermocoprophilus TaxID=78356 RepID=A0ABV5VNY4_9ACTN|nr:hypothetical protein [Streptomyces sp. XM83C]MCK1819555.1 hypothetical protein [Streptomyces sp. XM83C]